MSHPHAMVYNGLNWEIVPKNDVINQLFDDKQCFLITTYRDIKGSLKTSTRRKFERFMNEPDKSVIEGLKENIKLLLYNKRDIPQNTFKSIKHSLC